MLRIQMSARRAVWEILNQFKAEKQNASALIEKYASESNRRAVTDITFGIVRNSIFIDKFISTISGRAVKNIQPKLLTCLRIAIYELIFTQQAQYAIIDEAVELAKKTGSKKSAGFVNAVLRKAGRTIKNKNARLNESEPSKTLPLNTETGCEFTVEILPEENKEGAKYLSEAFSLPLWLIKLWISQFGYEQTKKICFASNRRPSIYARPNKLKITAIKVVDILKSENVDCEMIEQSKMVKLNNPGNIAELESFKSGLFTIQDTTAASVIKCLQPRAEWKILDICAAPGTKTTQIAELTCDKANIIATDKDDSRLNKIYENIQRLGIKSIRVLKYNEFIEESSRFTPADAVLLDVPCSNTGVLAKRPEVRLRLNQKQISELAKTQSHLLEFASKLLAVNGKICYSTCSILRQENEDTVNQFLNSHPEFELEKDCLILPSAEKFDCDGGYCAIVRKKA